MAKESRRAGLLVLAACALGSSIVSAVAIASTMAPSNAKPAYPAVPGQFLVQVKAPALSRFTAGSLAHALGASDAVRVRPDVFLVQRPIGERVEAATATMNAQPFVRIVEPNYIYKASRAPNDAKYGELWGMSNVGQPDSAGNQGVAGIDISAEKAWDVETGSDRVTVAVIDTGVDFSIPDLAPNAWTNEAEKNGQAGVDDDGNGYVDDVHGYDFANDKGDVGDDNGHGSHCAGTAGARGDDGRGVAGVSWNSRIMAVKFLDAGGSGSLANAIRAIDYARKNGARIMSNSWGGGAPSELLKKAIEDAKAAGSLFVAAAGNDGSDNDARPSYPASYPVDNVVSVAAIDNQGRLANFSNYGRRSVHVGAPGVRILSTAPAAIHASGFETLSGTSMATPHVSGVAALVLSHEPNLTYQELRERLIRSARPIAGLRGRVASGGMIDAYLAVTGQMAPPDESDPVNWPNKQAFSASTPHPYGASMKKDYVATVAGAKKVAVHFAKFDTEAGFDLVEFYDKNGRSLGKMSGEQDGSFSPVAEGDTIVLRFSSDDSVNRYGFDVDSISYVP